MSFHSNKSIQLNRLKGIMHLFPRLAQYYFFGKHLFLIQTDLGHQTDVHKAHLRHQQSCAKEVDSPQLHLKISNVGSEIPITCLLPRSLYWYHKVNVFLKFRIVDLQLNFLNFNPDNEISCVVINLVGLSMDSWGQEMEVYSVILCKWFEMFDVCREVGVRADYMAPITVTDIKGSRIWNNLLVSLALHCWVFFKISINAISLWVLRYKV